MAPLHNEVGYSGVNYTVIKALLRQVAKPTVDLKRLVVQHTDTRTHTRTHTHTRIHAHTHTHTNTHTYAAGGLRT